MEYYEELFIIEANFSIMKINDVVIKNVYSQLFNFNDSLYTSITNILIS